MLAYWSANAFSRVLDDGLSTLTGSRFAVTGRAAIAGRSKMLSRLCVRTPAA